MERVDFIYTSDLKRARQTTKKISKRHQDAIVLRDRRLREKVCVCVEKKKGFFFIRISSNKKHNNNQAAGIYEGTPIGSCTAAARAAGVAERDFRPEGGESWTDVEQRAEDFWQFILSKHSSTDVLENIHPAPSVLLDNKLPHVIVVTHSGFIASLLYFLSQHATLPRVDTTRSVLHASITTIFAHPSSLHLLRSNDVAHLKGLMKPSRPLPMNNNSNNNNNNNNSNSKTIKRTIATSPPCGLLALRQVETATISSSSSSPPPSSPPLPSEPTRRPTPVHTPLDAGLVFNLM